MDVVSSAPDRSAIGSADLPLVSFPEIVDGLGDGISVMDARGRFVFANPSAVRILGIGLDVMNCEAPPPTGWLPLTADGRPWTRETHPSMITLRTGKSCADVIMRVEKPEGGRIWVSVNTQPLFHDGHALPYAVVSTFSDITSRRAAEESLHLQKTLLEAQTEACRDAILLVGADRRILSANRRCLEMWGVDSGIIDRPVAEVAGTLIEKLANRDDFERIVRRFVTRLDEIRATGDEFVFVDGRIVVSYGVPICRDDGSLFGRVVYFQDVTEERRAQQEILRQKTLLEAEADATREGMLMISPDGAIASVNQRFCELWGVGRDEIVGLSVDVAFQRVMGQVQPASRALASIDDFIEGTDVPRGIIRFVDGRVFEYYGTAVRDPDGHDYGRAVFFLDVTDRQRAREAIEELSHRHELILNAAGEGIIGLGKTGQIGFVNPSVTRLTGFVASKLIGESMHALFHHTRADGSPLTTEDSPILRVLRTGRPSHGSGDLFRRMDGTSFPVEYVCAPIVQGLEVVGAVVTFKDISERYRVEKMKDEFISVVSHELRTPLTSIRGSLGLMAAGLVGAVPPRAQRMLDIAVKNTDRLVDLINDILDIERIESGKITMQREDCDAADLIKQATEVMQTMADSAGIRIEVGPVKARLHADPSRIVQVLTNLLSNAIKFSSPGGRIVVRAERWSDQVMFRVSDEGRGIPVDKLDLIFGRFQQVDASDSRDKGGTGLGLTICRSIVQQHGGRIWAESGPSHGPGSSFVFTIPRGVPSEGPATVDGDVQPFNPDDALPLALVCGANAEAAGTLARFLVQQGYRVQSVPSEAEIADVAARVGPDVIILDSLLPDWSGRDTLVRLRANAETVRIPVVIVSAVGPETGHHPVGKFDTWLTGPVRGVAVRGTSARADRTRRRQSRVLVIEDDPDLAAVLVATFRRHGIITEHTASLGGAIACLDQRAFDLLILDLILPDGNGFDVIDWLGKNRVHTAPSVVVYTARDLDDAERRRVQSDHLLFLTKARIPPDEVERRVLTLLQKATQASR